MSAYTPLTLTCEAFYSTYCHPSEPLDQDGSQGLWMGSHRGIRGGRRRQVLAGAFGDQSRGGLDKCRSSEGRVLCEKGPRVSAAHGKGGMGTIELLAEGSKGSGWHCWGC